MHKQTDTNTTMATQQYAQHALQDKIKKNCGMLSSPLVCVKKHLFANYVRFKVKTASGKVEAPNMFLPSSVSTAFKMNAVTNNSTDQSLP